MPGSLVIVEPNVVSQSHEADGSYLDDAGTVPEVERPIVPFAMASRQHRKYAHGSWSHPMSQVTFHEPSHTP